MINRSSELNSNVLKAVKAHFSNVLNDFQKKKSQSIKLASVKYNFSLLSFHRTEIISNAKQNLAASFLQNICVSCEQHKQWPTCNKWVKKKKRP